MCEGGRGVSDPTQSQAEIASPRQNFRAARPISSVKCRVYVMFDSFCRLMLFADITLFAGFDWVNSKNNVRELCYIA